MSPPRLLRTVPDLRAHVAEWRAAGDRVALVPTMGALHEGHLALVARAREEAARVVVTIFVNPTQFAPSEDLGRYPRDEAADLAKLAGRADAVFAPAADEMYPAGFATRIAVAGPAEGLESETRPHFFSGVATVVAKLLLQCLPDVAVFGEKDYQQLQVVTRLARDLDIPTRILGVPTARETDGLALSSRNAYLSRAERAVAPALHRALAQAAAALADGVPEVEALAAARMSLQAAGFRTDYVEARNAETLGELVPGSPARILAAAWLGGTRLIDNVEAAPAQGHANRDSGQTGVP